MSARINLQKALLVLVFLFLGYFCASLVIPLILIQSEDKILKEELNNPHISTDFASWKTENISDFGEILIPSNWNLTDSISGYQLTDSSGSIIAFCAEVGSDKPYEDTGALLADLLSDPSAEIAFDYLTEVIMIDSSDFCIVTATSKLEKEHVFFRLCLYKNSDEELVFLFPADNIISKESLFEIAQAMIYAYCFVIAE